VFQGGFILQPKEFPEFFSRNGNRIVNGQLDAANGTNNIPHAPAMKDKLVRQKRDLNSPMKSDDPSDILHKWVHLEQRYRANLYNGKGQPNSFRLTGNPESLILITSPHSVNQIRDGRQKYADKMTGGLAELLALLSNSQS
jgi:hypothetical protein